MKLCSRIVKLRMSGGKNNFNEWKKKLLISSRTILTEHYLKIIKHLKNPSSNITQD